jgi:hypothetical protein
LAFVQGTEKQYQGRLALVEGEGAALLLLRGWAELTRQNLSLASSGIPGAVDIRPQHPLARQPLLAHQAQQWPRHVHLKHPRQLGGVDSLLGVVDETLGRVHQRTPPREVDVTVGPESALIEVGHLVECVVAAAMGVAGVVSDLPQLPEHSHVYGGAEGGLQLLDGGDPRPSEEGHDAVSVKLNWAHSVRPRVLVGKSNITAP